nr:hypothetical protein [Armatimonas sp.]
MSGANMTSHDGIDHALPNGSAMGKDYFQYKSCRDSRDIHAALTLALKNFDTAKTNGEFAVRPDPAFSHLTPEKIHAGSNFNVVLYVLDTDDPAFKPNYVNESVLREMNNDAKNAGAKLWLIPVRTAAGTMGSFSRSLQTFNKNHLRFMGRGR